MKHRLGVYWELPGFPPCPISLLWGRGVTGRLTYLLKSRVTLWVQGKLIPVTEFSRGHAMFMKGTLFVRCIQRTSNVGPLVKEPLDAFWRFQGELVACGFLAQISGLECGSNLPHLKAAGQKSSSRCGCPSRELFTWTARDNATIHKGAGLGRNQVQHAERPHLAVADELGHIPGWNAEPADEKTLILLTAGAKQESVNLVPGAFKFLPPSNP